MAEDHLGMPLEEIVQLTEARWAAWLVCSLSTVNILHSQGVDRRLHERLAIFLERKGVLPWIVDASQIGQIRTRAVPAGMDLDCERLYLFPVPGTERCLLVGAGDLAKIARKTWQLVAYSSRIPGGADGLSPDLESSDFQSSIIPDIHLAFEHVLRYIGRHVHFDGGWLAILRGDYLEVKAHVSNPKSLDQSISIEANPFLHKVIHSQTVHAITPESSEWKHRPAFGDESASKGWCALPLVIGQRLIGLIMLWWKNPLPVQDWEILTQLAVRVAPMVEENVTFSSLTDHLRRLALLNDFVLAASSAPDLQHLIQRVFGLLKRAFSTEYINLYLLTSNGKSFEHYRDDEGRLVLHTGPAEGQQALDLVKRGITRIQDLAADRRYTPVTLGAKSALVVPLKYRQQIVGALGLESTRQAAFSLYDEHLLVVIASHLSGLIENGRLRQEAEARAHNLEFLHQVVQRVIGLIDENKIAQVAIELTIQNFDYELAGLMLVSEDRKVLRVAGIGGSAEGKVREALKSVMPDVKTGITGKVFSNGKSILSNDVSQNLHYQPLRGWDAGSEICVALKEGGEVLGVIDVESRKKNAFTPNDLIVLEALAGILASVLISARQYSRLQMTIQELQDAREELQKRVQAQQVAENRLIQAAKMAAVGEMAAGVAHELNNPLTSVVGFTELVLDEMDETVVHRPDLELVLREAHRARDVVRRLLDFARQSESVKTRGDLNGVVTDVLALVKHLLHTSGIQVETRLAKKIPWAYVDHNQVKQVLLNLIHNALHAMPDGGRLFISTSHHQRDGRGWATIEVRDTGLGIPPENIDRLFEPFFTTRSKDGGTGLGLAISYGIVSDQGGFIEVESKVGSGSSFKVWLPLEVSQ